MKKWHELPGETSPKDKPMELTNDNYHRIIGMRDELIEEQRIEISKLKAKVNQLRQKQGLT